MTAHTSGTRTAALTALAADTMRMDADYLEQQHDAGVPVPTIVASLRRMAIELEVEATTIPDTPPDF